MTDVASLTRRQLHRELALAQHAWDGGAGASVRDGEMERVERLLARSRQATVTGEFAPETVVIVATDEAGGIGIDGKMPWHCPVDLARFRKLTSGHLMVIGRKTHESIGRVLPARTTAVLSRHSAFEGTVRLADPRDLPSLASSLQVTTAFVAGGGEVYGMFIDGADRVERTVVSGTYPCDTRFPFDLSSGFDLANTRTAVDGGRDIRFETWLRKAG